MKHKIFFTLVLSCIVIAADCQVSKRDSIKNEVDNYVQTVSRAAAVFLNRRLPTEERLKAIAPHAVIYDEKQIAQFKQTVLSSDETPEIRAMALSRLYPHVEKDDALYRQTIAWFSNPQTPPVLRRETLNLISNLSFSSLIGVLDVYPKMVQDPDPDFRMFAISRLMMNGDARTEQLLIRGLEDPSSALVKPADAIELLSLTPKKDYYPTVFKVLTDTKDEAARLAAVQALGAYKEARQKLVSISRDPNEKEDFRVSALIALYSGDKDNIVSYVAPILQDKTATPRLQTTGIQMTINVRKTMVYRKSKTARRSDDYDQKIRDIAEGRGVLTNPEVRETANKYLLLVKPNF
ncbi:MAG: HEAT repeat domain-containing protein [Chitinophagaceae bacterium]|nr:HEAT repeat domain-containing protein [Chitinophagaceae bacterium]